MNKKILVAYFSASGVTAKAAKKLAAACGAETYEIKPQTLYTPSDLDWTNERSRSSVEMADASSRPALADKNAPVAQSDVVFLGFPIWWYTAPTIIKTFLESYDFSGKEIVLFVTSGGSGLGRTENDLKPCAPNAVWKGGRLLNGVTESALKAWTKSLNL